MTETANQRTLLQRRLLPRGFALFSPFAALLLAWWAQGIIDQGDNLRLGVAAYFVAAVLFVWGVWRQSLEHPGKRLESGDVTPIRLPLVMLALALSPVVFVESSGNQFRLLGVLVWFSSILLFLVGLPHPKNWTRGFARLRVLTPRKGIEIRWEFVALAAITLVGAFYRFYKLDGILAEMGTDLPLKYGNIEEVLNGSYPIFFTSFPGRESLFFYFASIPAMIFGLSFLTIKFSAAVVGTLTIPALFFLARRLFNVEVGLYGALLLAINHWHIALSRIGYRAVLIPFFIFVLLYLFARAVDRRRDWDFAFVGLWTGLGMYTYSSWLLAPIALGLALVTHAIARRDLSIQSILRFGVIAAIGGFLVWVPLGRYIVDQSDTYFGRVATRVTSEEQQLPPDVVGTFANNLKRTLAMFNYHGDSVFVVNVPYMREMEFATAVLFIIGTAYFLVRWRHGYNVASLSLFIVMLAPSALSIAFPNEAPNSDRSSGGMAVAFLFAALPLVLLRQHLAVWLRTLKVGPFALRIPISSTQELRVKAGKMAISTAWLVPSIGLVLLFGDAKDSFHTYFVDYPNAQPYHNYPLSLELAQALDDFAGNGPVYIKYLPYWYDGNALRAQLQRTPQTWNNESDHFDTNSPPFADFQGRFMYILHPDDKDGLAFLQQAFPAGTWVDHYDSLGTVEFVSFYGVK
jgi:hypothetical protein